MSKVNDLMGDLEEEIKFLETDKTHRNLKQVIDEILSEDSENKRHLAEG